MVWLLSHIWIGLALAALFGLLFGWAFRGISLKGKARDAMVQRDIALTELEQSRLEVDQLYAAQTKGVDAAAQAGDDTLRLELEAREEKLQALSKELSASQSELEDLKSKALLGAGAAATGAIAAIGAAAVKDETVVPAPLEERLDANLNINDASLEWRNRYLNSRVRALEATSDVAEDTADQAEALETANLRAQEAETALEAFKTEAEDDKQKAIAAALAASAASAAVGAALASNSDDEDDIDLTKTDDGLALTKQAWQTNYLRQRLSGLQAANVDVLPEEETNNESEVAALPVAAAATVDAAAEAGSPALSEEAEDDIAMREKAAWKSGFLEQRLAYLEDNPPKERSLTLVSSNADAETEDDVIEANAALADVEAGEEADQGEDPGAMEQELARLRWRNRYLEGRLAYIDGDAPKSEAELAAESQPSAEEALQDEQIIASTTSDEEEASDRPGDATPAEAVLAAMAGLIDTDEADNAGDDEAALARSATARGQDGDDLTRIEGVDEATAQKLNRFGVKHFYQIAGWTPEDIAQIDETHGFNGRVETENWVNQAGALSLGVDLSET